jgi:DNA-binding SARP family transcriptional activator/tetratricopeptide (TPR) repeat protein
VSALDILGPLRLHGPHGDVQLGGDKPRRLLAVLAVYANEVVSGDRLTEAVWGAWPPRSARENLQTYVWSLRRAIKTAGVPGIQIAAVPLGYILRVEPQELDWLRFTHLVAAAEECIAHEPAVAAKLLREALSCWQGPVLADVGDDVPTLRPRLTAMAEARLDALESRIRADLACGKSRELLTDLAELVAAHPLREHLRELQMLALYRSGRQAEALAAFHELRTQLAGDLGIDPDPDVRLLYQQILRADPSLNVPGSRASAVTAPRQLRARISGFTGRETELEQMDSLLNRAGEITVMTLSGPPGVGKTALALQWAHSVQERFPDGTLFADLHGYDAEHPPADAGNVIDAFLRALAFPPEEIPADVAERSARLRSALDGKMVLIVLDNVLTAAQVRPLLPGSAGSVVVVTSRSRLSGLAVREGSAQVPVHPMTEADSVNLLRHAVGERVAIEHATAAEVSRLCAGLPLALRIAANRVVASPALGLSGLATQLADERNRLAILETDDRDVAVRAAFGSSYDTLDAAAARMFRLSSVHPAREFSVPAAASVAGVGEREAVRLLGKLSESHLVETMSPGRMRLHDLLAVYARERTVDAERDDALRRLLAWYLHTADAANRLLVPGRLCLEVSPVPEDCRPLRFTGYDDAFSWCETERNNVVAAGRRALIAGDLEMAWQLPAAFGLYLKLSSRWEDWVSTHRAGLDAARRLDNTTAQAWFLNSLAGAYGDLHRFDDAADCTDEALRIGRADGDVAGQARALLNHGFVRWKQQRFDDGIRSFRQSLELARSVGDQYTEAMALNNLGDSYLRLGRFAEALEHLMAAYDAWGLSGDLYNQAATLDSQGNCQRRLGNLDEAIRLLEESVPLRRRNGDRQGEALTLDHIAEAFLQRGDHEEARRRWLQSLAILEDLGDPEADRIRARLGDLPL